MRLIDTKGDGAKSSRKIIRLKVTQTLYAKNRKEWRAWLAKHHKTAKEVWLIYYRKSSAKPRIPYNHAVEEALCYGWIDSILKPIDDERFAQRFSPRRKSSALSEMNKERIRRLIKAKKMTRWGLASIEHHLTQDAGTQKKKLAKFKLPKDILDRLKADPVTWKNFRGFPETYQHIRVAWIDGARNRPAEFSKRLNYFLKMTAQNKQFGMAQ